MTLTFASLCRRIARALNHAADLLEHRGFDRIKKSTGEKAGS